MAVDRAEWDNAPRLVRLAVVCAIISWAQYPATIPMAVFLLEGEHSEIGALVTILASCVQLALLW